MRIHEFRPLRLAVATALLIAQVRSTSLAAPPVSQTTPATKPTVAQKSPAPQPATGELAYPAPIDLSGAPDGTVVAVVVHPKHLLTAPEAELWPTEILSVAGKKELGIDPLTCERITIFLTPPSPNAPPAVMVTATFTEAFDQEKFLAFLQQNQQFEEVEIAGRKGYAVGPKQDRGFVLLDKQHIVAGTQAEVERFVKKEKPAGANPALKIIGAQGPANDLMVAVNVEALRPVIEKELAQNNDIPPELEQVKQLPSLIQLGMAKLNVRVGTKNALLFKANSAEDAVKANKIVAESIEFGRKTFLAQIENESSRSEDPNDPVVPATKAYMNRLANYYVNVAAPTLNGDVIGWQATNEPGNSMVYMYVMSVMAFSLAPAIQAARNAAQRSNTSNNLKQILLAMHNHAAAMQAFPRQAISDKQGKPLLSWRVALLPYLEEANLYEEFHRDEPWDSEHNLKVAAKMPAIYLSPSSKAGVSEKGVPLTNYLAIAGEGMAFSGAKATRFADIRDGTSNTILVVEADDSKAVPWTKPDDLEVDLQKPREGLGGMNPTGAFVAGFADGSVRIISSAVKDEVIAGAFTIKGGEVINLDAE